MDKEFEAWIAGNIEESLVLPTESPYLCIREYVMAVFEKGREIGFMECESLNKL